MKRPLENLLRTPCLRDKLQFCNCFHGRDSLSCNSPSPGASTLFRKAEFKVRPSGSDLAVCEVSRQVAARTTSPTINRVGADRCGCSASSETLNRVIFCAGVVAREMRTQFVSREMPADIKFSAMVA